MRKYIVQLITVEIKVYSTKSRQGRLVNMGETGSYIKVGLATPRYHVHTHPI